MPNSILVTGGTGFVGSNLVPVLSGAGYDVDILAHTESGEAVPDNIEISVGDITDFQSLPSFSGYDTVIHLAGVVSVQESIADPVGTFRTNALGTQHVLERVREEEIDEFIYLSSGAVYGNPDHLPIDEAQATECLHPYASSKLAGEKVAETYANAYDLSVTTLRGFTLYGPGQDTDNLIPTVIEQIEAGADTVSLGNLEPTRDFTYIDDLTSAVLTVISESSGQYNVYNAGSGCETSVGDLVTEIVAQSDSDIIVESDNVGRASDIEIERMVADISKLRELGWEPRYDIRRGIEATLNKSNRNNE